MTALVPANQVERLAGVSDVAWAALLAALADIGLVLEIDEHVDRQGRVTRSIMQRETDQIVYVSEVGVVYRRGTWWAWRGVVYDVDGIPVRLSRRTCRINEICGFVSEALAVSA